MRKKTKLLLIESVRDRVTLQRRMNLFNQQGTAAKYDISIIYLVEPEDFLAFTGMPEMLLERSCAFGEPLPNINVEKKIVLRSLAQANLNEIDYIFFYVGFTIYQFQLQLYLALVWLKRRNPHLKIAQYSNKENVDIAPESGDLEDIKSFKYRGEREMRSRKAKGLIRPPVGLLDNSDSTNAVRVDLLSRIFS